MQRHGEQARWGQVVGRRTTAAVGGWRSAGKLNPVIASEAQEPAGRRRNPFSFIVHVLSHLFCAYTFVAHCGTSAQVRRKSQPAGDSILSHMRHMWPQQ